jgi:hypothetical protein
VIHTNAIGVRLALVGALVVGAAAVPAVGAPAGVAAAHAASLVATPRGSFAAAHSLNWAGYVKTGAGFTSTAATWRVPTLKTTYPGYSSTWVGIDGGSASDKYLIQTGIEADVVNGKASYYAWWELITPSDQAPEIRFSTVPVKPGDSVTAKVAKATGGNWTMTFTDNTTKKTASHTAAYAGKGASAEWIEEDTDVDGQISAAPDWQSVSFGSILLNGKSPALSSSQAVDIVCSPGLLGGLLGQPGVRETATGAPNSTRNGFKVTWLATGSPSPAG